VVGSSGARARGRGTSDTKGCAGGRRVERGADDECFVQVGREAPLAVAGGRVVMLPHGDVHVLSSQPGLQAMRITTDMTVKLARPDSMARVRDGGGGAARSHGARLA
jgi:hypothetical protein